MIKNIVQYAKKRHTAKAYNPTKTISKEDIESIKQSLKLAVSSTNCQPWHFIIASSIESKEKIAKSTDEKYVFNSKPIRDASHVVIFCTKTDMDDAHLIKVLEKEDKDGRYPSVDHKTQMDKGRRMFVNLNKNNLFNWLEKQTYINFGTFVISCASMGIDATPMEGFDKEVLDKEFGLSKNGLQASLVVPIGYSDDQHDYNKHLPKSRLDEKEIITEC